MSNKVSKVKGGAKAKVECEGEGKAGVYVPPNQRSKDANVARPDIGAASSDGLVPGPEVCAKAKLKLSAKKKSGGQKGSDSGANGDGIGGLKKNGSLMRLC